MLVNLLKHFKAFIIMLMILSVIIGLYAFKTFPKEASPAINVPFFTISIVYPGADPETIEKQVIEKLENNLSSVTQVKEVKSISAYNVGVISIEFDRGKEIGEAYSDLNSAIDKTRGDFPDDVKEPVLKRVDMSDSPIYTFSITGPNLPSVLYDKIRNLEDKLQATPGVSEVDVIGSYTPEIKIKFDYEKLLKNKINFSYAISEISTYIDKFPADKKEIDSTLYTFTLKTYPNDFDKIVDFLDNLTLVNQFGNTLLLGDVAKITTGPSVYKKESYLMNNGETYSSVTYSIKKIPGSDILETIDSVKQVLNNYGLKFSDSNYIPEPNFIDKIFSSNKNISENNDLSDLEVYEINSQKEKIDSTYKTFLSNFRQTTVIIFLVILIFIGYRESIGITLVFPLVYLISFIALKTYGYTFNNIVSFSLVLTLGIMVDNLIVVIEGFEEGMKKGLKKWDAISFSIKTYWKPILSGNFTTISMFLPIGFMLSGKIGDFMKYMPTTVDVVLIISIFVSLVFLPIVLSFLTFKIDIKKNKKGEDIEENKLFLKLEGFFKKIIINYKKAIFAFVLLFFITIGIASQFLKADFLPPTDTNNIYVNLKFSSDITLEENKKIVSDISYKIDNYFKENKGLLAYQGINIGDYKSLDPLDNVVYGNSYNPDLAYIDLKLTDKDFERKYESYSIVQDLKNVIKIDDFDTKLLSMEIFIQKSGPSGGKDVNFYLVGNNLDSLVTFYDKIESEIKGIAGTYDWSNSLEYTNGKFDITWDIEKLKQFNITAKELDVLIASVDNSESYDPNGILLKKMDDFSSDLINVKAFTEIGENNILDIMVPGRDIYLKQLIKNIELVGEVKSIIHTDSKLILNIGAYKTKETSLGSITPNIDKIVEKYSNEIPGVSLEYAGDVKDMQNSMIDLVKAFGIGILLMFTVLVLHFGNFRQPFLVLSVIPFLFIGAVLLLTISGLPFSFPAQLGMFGLMGVGVNDAILLIERYNNEKNQKYKNNDDLILDVIRARFKPVLLTTLTTVLGLSTLAIKDALWGSLAVAFIGGLLLGTFIILVYIPAMLKWGLVRKDKH
ncbi:MAG: efflux RND transporter permease subunit [Candidatus Gracilibacteria bacterium]|nr:efflux RND transporter permease subunit [Candidatus Gracilibacteria bacterium]